MNLRGKTNIQTEKTKTYIKRRKSYRDKNRIEGERDRERERERERDRDRDRDRERDRDRDRERVKICLKEIHQS